MMTTALFSRSLLLIALLCAACAARAQSSAPASAPAPAVAPPAVAAPNTKEQSLLDRKTQKVEHLHFEDAGNRVDEIRAGGQTRRITVRPKDGAPAYDVQPANPNTLAPDAGIGRTGPRMWRIREF